MIDFPKEVLHIKYFLNRYTIILNYSVDIIRDSSVAQELDNSELLDMRKMYEKERTSNKLSNPVREDFEVWQTISNKMLPNARELCEQLRLILEPTKCTRLKGDYRTGRRINMKKVRILLQYFVTSLSFY